MDIRKQSIFRIIIGMMINPAGALRSAFTCKWYLALSVSALAFGLFFAQTGLDLYKTGQKNWDFVFLSVITGILYGLLIIPLIGVMIWAILKFTKSKKDVKWIVSTFCLSYSGALIYGIIGLVFSIVLAWKTSVAFGVTGVLWAIGPMIITIRAATDGKNAMSIPIATIVCSVVLLSWSLFGQI